MPEDRNLMHAMARYIEDHCDETLTLVKLAEQAQMSPAYLQRRFKAAIGLSPKEYAESCRMRRLKTSLKSQDSVTEAIYTAGFGSPSRIYEKLDSTLGMTPGQYRFRGKGAEISYAFGTTALGTILVGATDRGICFLQFGESEEKLLNQLRQEYPEAVLTPMPATHREQFHAWTKALRAYLKGESQRLDLPLDIRGTAFQQKVWKYLQTIPFGHTASYTEIAKAIKQPKAFRAVANACARNNIAIVIPCHRVIRGNGGLAGYRWGTERKRALLGMEKNIEDLEPVS
jgi:AraC family transcriptional regulator, regulatory protein of adaptative response / methylated-DNA-[protein]-cysteine methyltransferase